MLNKNGGHAPGLFFQKRYCSDTKSRLSPEASGFRSSNTAVDEGETSLVVTYSRTTKTRICDELDGKT